MVDGGPLDALQHIKATAQEIEDALRRQDHLLNMRSMALQPAVFRALDTVRGDIDRLEERLVEDLTTLSQFRTLAGTSEQINSSLDLDEVLSGAMDRVIVLTGAERGYIVLTEAEAPEARWEVRIARDAAGETQLGTPTFQGSRTILKQVLESGQTLLTDNAYNDPTLGSNATIASMTLRSVLCVPLKLKEQVTGAVYVDNRLRAGVFTSQAETLLTAFANQASIAIANARLFADVQASIQMITELKDLMDNIFASIGSGVITTNLTDEVLICNAAAERILDHAAAQAIGRPLPELLPESSVDLAESLHTAIARDEHQILDVEWDSPANGHQILDVKISPLKDAGQATQGAALVMTDLTQQRENEEMLGVMRRYLPPAMVDNIHTIAALALGGERRETSCVFIDVRALSTFPADLRPPQIMETLNLYLAAAADCIHRAGGVIDKYMGHEIMGLFNSQLNPLEDHAGRALAAALDMRDVFMQLYAEMGLNPNPHFYRVGIHTGVATLGNVGSEIRRDFTAIGDTINLSKRLEENAAPGQIIVSEDTHRHIELHPGLLCLDDVQLIEHDAIQVKGRQQRTRIYEVFRAS